MATTATGPTPTLAVLPFTIVHYTGGEEHDNVTVENILSRDPDDFHCSDSGKNHDLLLKYDGRADHCYLTHAYVRGPPSCTAPVKTGIIFAHSGTEAPDISYSAHYNDFTRAQYEATPLEQLARNGAVAYFTVMDEENFALSLTLQSWPKCSYVHVKFISSYVNTGGDDSIPSSNIDIERLALIGFDGSNVSEPVTVTPLPFPSQLPITLRPMESFNPLLADFGKQLFNEPALVVFLDDPMKTESAIARSVVQSIAESGDYKDSINFFYYDNSMAEPFGAARGYESDDDADIDDADITNNPSENHTDNSNSSNDANISNSNQTSDNAAPQYRHNRMVVEIADFSGILTKKNGCARSLPAKPVAAIVMLQHAVKFVYGGEWSEASMREWIDKWSSQELQPSARSAARPENDSDPLHPGITVVTANTFDELVIDGDSDVLLHVSQGWPEPSPSLPLIWHLAKLYTNDSVKSLDHRSLAISPNTVTVTETFAYDSTEVVAAVEADCTATYGLSFDNATRTITGAGEESGSKKFNVKGSFAFLSPTALSISFVKFYDDDYTATYHGEGAVAGDNVGFSGTWTIHCKLTGTFSMTSTTPITITTKSNDSARPLPKLVIATLNSGENDVNAAYFPENDLPIIKMFPAGQKSKPVLFAGKTRLSELLKFIDGNVGNQSLRFSVCETLALAANANIDPALEEREALLASHSKLKHLLSHCAFQLDPMQQTRIGLRIQTTEFIMAAEQAIENFTTPVIAQLVEQVSEEFSFLHALHELLHNVNGALFSLAVVRAKAPQLFSEDEELSQQYTNTVSSLLSMTPKSCVDDKVKSAFQSLRIPYRANMPLSEVEIKALGEAVEQAERFLESEISPRFQQLQRAEAERANRLGRVQPIHSEQEFDAALAQAKSTGSSVVIDMTAAWCGPCKRVAPVFADLSDAHTKLVFLKVDVDEVESVSRRYEVESMPTFIFLGSNGEEIANTRIQGANVPALKARIVAMESATPADAA